MKIAQMNNNTETRQSAIQLVSHEQAVNYSACCAPLLWKDPRHDHFWIEDEQLFESYSSIRGLRYRHRMEVKGMPDSDKCTDAMIKHIEKEYLS